MFIIISKYFLRIFIFFKQLLITYLFLSSLLFYAAPSPEIQIISNSESTNIENEAVDLLISYRFGDKQNSQRLFGTFSNAGSNYETAGDIIQVFPYRACDMKRKGFDRTLIDHIAVIFFDELEPFIVGCVSLDNQVRFAEKSGALGLVVGPGNRVVMQINNKLERGRIPVVVLDDVETKKLKIHLNDASQSGSIIKLSLQYVDVRPQFALHLQVFRPTVLNIGLIITLALLVFFITGLVFIKIKWKPASHRDIWLRTLARSAINKMEVRKFEKVVGYREVEDSRTGSNCKSRKLLCLSAKRKYVPVFGSLASITPSCSIQERCSICLEEYKEGQELRVLFCGHEFHPKCVDPWLINNRRCPLCQYDVVYKEYPKVEPIAKNNRANFNSIPPNKSSNQQELPLLPSINLVNQPSPQFSYMQLSNYIKMPSTRKKGSRPQLTYTPLQFNCHVHRVVEISTRCSPYTACRKHRNRDNTGYKVNKHSLYNRNRSFGLHYKRRYLRSKISSSKMRLPSCSTNLLADVSNATPRFSSDESSETKENKKKFSFHQYLPQTQRCKNIYLRRKYNGDGQWPLRPQCYVNQRIIATLNRITYEKSNYINVCTEEL